MGKKSRLKARSTERAAGAGPDAGTSNAGTSSAGTSNAGFEGTAPRQPCPCGSGRRYKACHGSAAGPVQTFVPRPFQGIAGECDLVAMREIIPAATAPLEL